MTRFLVTYHGGLEIPRDPSGARDPEFVPGGSAARNSAAVLKWFGKSGSAVTDWGGSVRPAATVSAEGIQNGRDAGPLNAWQVIEALDVDVAATLLQDHPFIILCDGLLQIWEPDDA